MQCPHPNQIIVKLFNEIIIHILVKIMVKSYFTRLELKLLEKVELFPQSSMCKLRDVSFLVKTDHGVGWPF